MKIGKWILLQRHSNYSKLFLTEGMMMEDAMVQYGITNTQDMFLIPNAQEENEVWIADFYNDVYRVVCDKATCRTIPCWDTFKDSNYMLVNSSRSNSIPTLMSIIANNESELTPMPELPKQKECEKCGRSLPEPDGFGGIKLATTRELVCFDCYQKGGVI